MLAGSPLLSHVLGVLAGSQPASEDTAACDEALAVYVVAMSQRLTDEGLTLVLQFLSQLRLCLNSQGPTICGGLPGVFCESNTAQKVPDIANFFISEYLDTVQMPFSRETAISLTMHLCRWLFVKRYSNLKLSLSD